MEKKFTASEVRESAIAVASRDMEYEAEILRAYADRLEADEKAVPVYQFSIYNKRGELEWMTCSKLSFDKQPEESRRILYTHPAPADAERLAEALRSIRASLISVLCDPSGRVVIHGSDYDRKVIAKALQKMGVLAAHLLPKRTTASRERAQSK